MTVCSMLYTYFEVEYAVAVARPKVTWKEAMGRDLEMRN